MARKKDGNAEELEIEQMSRTELARLQRQYRIMEGDREAYAEEMKILLQKQRKTIEILEKEKSLIFYELNSGKCSFNEMKIDNQSKKLKNLLRLHERLNKEVNREKSQTKEFDLQIRKVDKEFREDKLRLERKSARKEEAEGRNRARLQLENRLDVATVKLNRILAGNQNLRRQIDHFLKERSLFNRAHQELASRIEAGKKIIMDLMDQSTLAYDQREEAQGKLEALKQKGKQDAIIHGQEMKELQRKLDHDSKLQQFLGVKGQRRITADLEAKEALRKQQQKEAIEHKILHYRSLLESIRKISEETDVDRLSAQYLKQEEENFALFNYVNELNNELKAIQEQLDEIDRSVKEQWALNREKVAKKREAIERLAAEFQLCTRNRAEAERKVGEWKTADEDLLRGIRLLFDILRPVENPILRLLGEEADDVPVTSFNFPLYMEVIEKRAEQLGILYAYWKSHRGVRTTDVPTPT